VTLYLAGSCCNYLYIYSIQSLFVCLYTTYRVLFCLSIQFSRFCCAYLYNYPGFVASTYTIIQVLFCLSTQLCRFYRVYLYICLASFFLSIQQSRLCCFHLYIYPTSILSIHSIQLAKVLLCLSIYDRDLSYHYTNFAGSGT
jgi:hypothetical protein